MPSITQTIPNYVSGISEQPDELKTPGQLTVAKNVLPDVTQGLLKRPGGKLIGGSMTVSSDPVGDNSPKGKSWFHYYRDETEQYIGQIHKFGDVKIWRCSDGQAMTVTDNLFKSRIGNAVKDSNGIWTITLTNWHLDHGVPAVGDLVYCQFAFYANSNQNLVVTEVVSNTEFKVQDTDTSTVSSTAINVYWSYLTHNNDSDLQFLTLNDYTYITNRQKTVAMSSTVEPVRPPEAFIELKKVAYANQYAVNLFDDTTTTTVTTATRIEVSREVDSRSSCNSSGEFPSSGTLPGSTGYTDVCDNPASGGDSANDDDMSPNVATRIFSIDHGVSGDADDANGTAHTYTVTPNGGNASDRKNLYFRITTTGQSTPEGSSATPIYRTRYTTTNDLLYGGEGWKTGDVFYVWMKNAKYKITIKSHSESKVQANLGLIRPEPTSFDTKTVVTAESILGAIREDIVATSNFTDANVQQIGNGLYITRSSGTFNISTPVSELLNVLSSEVKDVADLPKQCKHGYVVKVANSEAEEDDYYVKFVGNNDRDGDGVWEECVKPGDNTTYDPATMPIQIVREANGTFTVQQVTYDPAQVGDTSVNGTNPRASFVGKTINNLLFFRNRLVMLSDENVIMSRPGDFFNFWAKSAISYTATDNIDISCSSEYPAIVYDGIQVNSGLVLFTKNQQFMLTTDSDVLSPLTAKINALSSYNFNYKSNPISLGTTVAFLDNAGQYNRFWEMTAVLREGEPNVIEQSKAISKSFDSDMDMVANSRENQVIFFGKKGTSKLYGFRYHTTSAQRIQQAWFTWEVKGEIQHIAMLDDALFVIAKDGSTYSMQRFSIRGLSDSLSIIDDQGTTSDTSDDINYRVHLDNSKQVEASAITYSSSTGKSTFSKPSGFDTSSTNLVVISYDADGDDSGRYATATINTSPNPDTVEIDGDWSSENVVLGYNYDMEVQFPTIYLQQQSNEQFRSQIHSSLVVHRVKFSLGPSGLYTTTLSRLGKDNYVQTHESPLADVYNPNRVAVNNVLKETVPVYEKNTNLTLTLKSTHPTPATLYSMTWEGDYTNKFYKSV
jgi:hypothetical protein